MEKRTNIVFIMPTKIAGTSILRALDLAQYESPKEIQRIFKQTGKVCFGHMDYSLLVKEKYVSQSFDSSAYRFSWVRNPYDRAVSLWLDMTYRGKGKERNKKLFRSLGFAGFCEQILARPMGPIGLYCNQKNSMYSPMIRWLENVNLDFIGRVENIEEDFSALLVDIGLDPIPLPYLRVSRDGYDIITGKWRRSTYREPWQNFYDKKSMTIVSEVYREDFERFNYPVYN